MGGGKKSKAPPAPDYAALANQEGQQNRLIAQEMTVANRPNQTDQYGNTVSWTRNPTTGQWSQSVKLSPQQQGIQNNFMTGQNLAQGIYNNTLSVYDRISQKDPMFGQHSYQQLPSSSLGTGGMRSVNARTPVGQASYGVGTIDPKSTNTAVNLANMGARTVTQGQGNTDVNLKNYAAGPIGGSVNTDVNLGNYGVNSITSGQAQTGVNMGAYGVQGINPNVANGVPQYDPNSGKSVADALYGSVMDRGRVEQQRETDRLTTQLRQQGLQPGTEGFDRAMRNLRTSQNDANLLAAQNATLAGGNEARSIYGAQLAGNQQRFGQMQGTNATNLSNAQFQQGMNQQNFQNLLDRQQANLGMAGAQQGMNQQNLENRFTQQQANLGVAAAQQGMNQQNFQNNLAGIDSNRANAALTNQMNQQNFQNLLGAQAGNRANWQTGEGLRNENFNQQLAAAGNQRDNYLAQLQGQGQAYGQALGNRQNNLQELGMLSSLSGYAPSTNFQSFGTATGYSPADMLGAASASHAARMQGYNAQNSKKGGLLGGGLSLGGSLLGGK